MSSKQARLIAAIRDKQNELGYTQRELSIACGTSQGVLSQALSGKGQMGEEKWRLLCGKLGLDYEEVVADLPAPVEMTQDAAGQETVEAAESAAPEQTLAEGQEAVRIDPRSDWDDTFEVIRRERQEKLQLLADYAAGRLQEDIHAGMDVDIDKLWRILDAIHLIKEGDIR